ncbi:MAG: pyridoxamine kinase [Lachnospiraceae bacterium]|nr:pyridoxamine kinase [Lachnospiraceae bacterium]
MTTQSKQENIHNHQKKIAAVNDFTGFGRCSLAVSIPIISVMKVQCCPLPTSILSNHTGFESCFFDDYTRKMRPYMEEWKKLRLSFDGILTGFLGSNAQIQMVCEFIETFREEATYVIVDPVMGDNGKIYRTYTPRMCRSMKKLVSRADVITPNLTEACILTDTPYHEDKWKEQEILRMARSLCGFGPERVVITGLIQGDYIANFCYEKKEEQEEFCFLRTHRAGMQRSGTGDIFASIIAADAVNQVPFRDSVKKASQFIKKCIERSMEMDIPLTDGVCFEELLRKLV